MHVGGDTPDAAASEGEHAASDCGIGQLLVKGVRSIAALPQVDLEREPKLAGDILSAVRAASRRATCRAVAAARLFDPDFETFELELKVSERPMDPPGEYVIADAERRRRLHALLRPPPSVAASVSPHRACIVRGSDPPTEPTSPYAARDDGRRWD